MESVSYLLLFLAGTFQASCNFVIIPSTQIVTQGETATFTCQNDDASSVGWNINQTSIARYLPSGVSSQSRIQTGDSGRGRLYTLIIEARLEYNGTTVECVGLFTEGPVIFQTSPEVLLLIQGTPDAVTSLSANFTSVGNFSLLVAWDTPFTLNLTNIEPDITYDVLIVSEVTSHQEYYLDGTMFLYVIPQHHNPCNSSLYFNITVVPINRAGQGIPKQIQTQYVDETRVVSVINALPINSESVRMEFYFLLNPGLIRVCNCKLSLDQNLMMIHGTIQHAHYVFDESNGLYCNSTTATLTVSDTLSLPFNSHYMGSIIIFKKEINISLSTYDIQSVHFRIDQSENLLQLMIHYTNNTRAKGAFLTLIPVSHSITLYHNYVSPRNNNITSISTLSTRVPFGIYKILAYDIEEDGLLPMPVATPAIVETVAILGTSFTSNDIATENSTNKDITLSTNILSHTLQINCNYHKLSDAQGCMVVVRSKAQPEDLTVKLQPRQSLYPLEYYVHPKISSVYVITAFAVGESGILNSSISTMELNVELEATNTASNHNLDVYKIALGTALSILSLIIIVIFVAFFGMKLKRLCKTKEKTENSTAIEMQKCEAYEVVSIQRRQR